MISRHRLLFGVAIGVVFVMVFAGTVLFTMNEVRDSGVHAPGSSVATARIGGAAPGSLLSATSTPNLGNYVPAEFVTAARVVYRSTEGDTGGGTEVSGMVFVPRGTAPAGGWPVLAYAHGSIGIDEPCGPSVSHDLAQQGPFITSWVRAGYAVAFPDFQGLGSPGIHPYLDSRTAALNLIDSVRALRLTFPGVSSRWAGYGPSQGGGAVWAANEQAASYAPELQLVGTSALAPATTPSELLANAESGALTPAQAPVFVWLLNSLHRLHPELNLDDFRRGSAAENWDVISACTGDLAAQRGNAISRLSAGELTPATPEAAAQVRALLTPWDLPQRPLSAPLSVIFGDSDPFVDSRWVMDAIEKECALGGVVVWRKQEGRGHDDLDATDQVQWIADRFAGQSVFNYCRA